MENKQETRNECQRILHEARWTKNDKRISNNSERIEHMRNEKRLLKDSSWSVWEMRNEYQKILYEQTKHDKRLTKFLQEAYLTQKKR